MEAVETARKNTKKPLETKRLAAQNIQASGGTSAAAVGASAAAATSHSVNCVPSLSQLWNLWTSPP